MTGAHPERFYVGILAVLAASVLSSIGWIFEGEAVACLSPLPVVCVSLLLGGSILLAYGAVTGRSKRSIIKAALSTDFVIYSLVRGSVLTLLFAYCLTLTSSTKAMFLTKMEPYVVLLIQVLFYGHRTTVTHMVLLAVHIGGAVLLSTGGVFESSLDVSGDLLLLCGVIGIAALYGPSKRYSHQMGAVSASGASQLLGGLALLPFMLIFSSDSFVMSDSHRLGWLYTFATVLAFYVLSTSLFFFSLKEVPVWLASALRCVGPVVAAPIAWVVFDKILSPIQILGALLVVVTSMWMVILEKAGKT